MKLAYFDCFAGISGDMIVGALLDAGCDFDALAGALAKLALPGCEVSAERVTRGGLTATKFNVEVDPAADQPHRSLADILAMIDSADLAAAAAAKAKAIFERLGRAEAEVHGVDIQEVHFHEVGAADSIMDIVGAAVALELMGIERVICSPVPTGNGTVETAHGTLPVPAPATAKLLAGAKVAETPPGVTGEMTTPTGAAVVTTLAESFGALPDVDLSAVGYGAGTREGAALPNVLRVFVGQAGEGACDSAVELSANLDDCTGEIIGATIAKLLAAGALDAWASPIYMKKSRPAWMLSALCAPADAARMEEIIFVETTTLGVRQRSCRRSKLARRHVTVETPYGAVRIKVAGRDGRDLTASPEFADAAAAAEAHGAPVREVIAAAIDAYRKLSE